MDVSGAEGAVVLPVQRYKACCGRLVDASSYGVRKSLSARVLMDQILIHRSATEDLMPNVPQNFQWQERLSDLDIYGSSLGTTLLDKTRDFDSILQDFNSTMDQLDRLQRLKTSHPTLYVPALDDVVLRLKRDLERDAYRRYKIAIAYRRAIESVLSAIESSKPSTLLMCDVKVAGSCKVARTVMSNYEEAKKINAERVPTKSLQPPYFPTALLQEPGDSVVIKQLMPSFPKTVASSTRPDDTLQCSCCRATIATKVEPTGEQIRASLSEAPLKHLPLLFGGLLHVNKIVTYPQSDICASCLTDGMYGVCELASVNNSLASHLFQEGRGLASLYPTLTTHPDRFDQVLLHEVMVILATEGQCALSQIHELSSDLFDEWTGKKITKPTSRAINRWILENATSLVKVTNDVEYIDASSGGSGVAVVRSVPISNHLIYTGPSLVYSERRFPPRVSKTVKPTDDAKQIKAFLDLLVPGITKIGEKAKKECETDWESVITGPATKLLEWVRAEEVGSFRSLMLEIRQRLLKAQPSRNPDNVMYAMICGFIAMQHSTRKGPPALPGQ